jgi:hypothetical protein
LPRVQANLRSGPSETYTQVGVLGWQDHLTIMERNRVGNWVHLNIVRGAETLDGWAQTGHLILDNTVRLSQIPISPLPDADPSTVPSQSMARLYNVPVIPNVSPAMYDVYARGQTFGNGRNVVTKIGDNLSASHVYLTPMSRGDHELGPYDYLEYTVNFFGASLAVPSVGSRVGMSTLSIFDPLWADDTLCEPNESPLICEYRRKQPSVAVILFGPNDVRSMDRTTYANQMRQIVRVSLDYGVIPVLMTFSADPTEQFWFQSVEFNLALADVAAEFQVPLINFWAAARPLPEYGLDVDDIHPIHSGWENLYYATGHEAMYGMSLQNLVTLTMLDEIRHTLAMG